MKGLASLLAGLLLFAAAAEAEPPRLRASVVVDGAVVTLGDVLEGAGPAAGIAVAPAPRPGGRAVLSAGQVYRVAQAHGLPFEPVTGRDRVVVTRASRIVDRESVEAAIAEALGGLEPGQRIELADRTLRLHLPTDARETLRVDGLAVDERRQRFRATIVTAPGHPDEARIQLVGRIYQLVTLPVPARRLSPGEVLREDDLEWRQVRTDQLPRNAITDAAEILGLTPRRTLAPGRPIRPTDLKRPVVVTRGAKVRMIYEIPGMTLTAGGRALDHGAFGDTVRVMNSQTQVIVEAVVAGGGLVTVGARLTSTPD